MSARVSVIVPVYNVEKYLDDCMESIRMQSYRNYEVILIDDGSTDKSSCMCDAYAARDKRIKVVHIPNGGISNARNTGIEAATGDYLYFLDSDDVIADRNVLRDMMHMITRPGIDLVEGRAINFDDGTEVSDAPPQKVRYRELTLNERTRRRMSSRMLAGFLFSAGVIGDTRFTRELIVGEDLLFSQQMLTKAKKQILTDRICLMRRIRNGSITHSGIAPKYKDNNRVFEKLMYAELHGKPGGDALLEAYLADRTADINQVLFDRRTFNKEKDYIRNHIARYFPRYLWNGNLSVSTRVYLTAFMINPDVFRILFMVYKKGKNKLMRGYRRVKKTAEPREQIK